MVLSEFLNEWLDGNSRLLVHTSGSTGDPKPMWVEKQRMLNSARMQCDFLGLRRGDTALLCMNLKYIGAKMVVVRAIERGLKLLAVSPSGHPLSAWAALRAQDVEVADFSEGAHATVRKAREEELVAPSFAAMVPMQVYNTLQVPDEARWLRGIRQLIIGGGAIDSGLETALQTCQHAVWSTYGMTETLSHIALRRLNGAEASEWYRPFEGVTVSLNSDDCLVIDAPMVHEGLLATHDRAVIRPGRGFKILGRKDNVIVSGGVKIQIEEVEKALAPHLHEPFVIARRPDVKFGEAVVLLTEAADCDAVMTVCRRVLPAYWVPKDVMHVDKIPMTETGKPKRNIVIGRS